MSSETADCKGGNQDGLLLALSTGLRETGWAVFQGSAVAATGVVGLKISRKVEAEVRISRQLEALTAVTSRWRANCVARSKPGGVNRGEAGLERLDASLRDWAGRLGLPLFDYASRDVRSGIAGRPNASRDAQCYAIMHKLGLIGQNRATAEWEAIAVGYYHRTLRQGRPGPVQE